MIDVSMIDNNLLQLNFQPVWINRLLNVLKIEMETAMKERCQIFEIFDFPGNGEMTFADPERLMQVFRNVLDQRDQIHPGWRAHLDHRAQAARFYRNHHPRYRHWHRPGRPEHHL